MHYPKLLVILLGIAVLDCAPSIPTIDLGEGALKTDSGLQYVALKEGQGLSPKPGEVVIFHAVGSLSDGSVFYNTRERGKPRMTAIDSGTLLAGLEEGLAMMKPGGSAKLALPPQLAFGRAGWSDRVPPTTPVIYEVELLSVTQSKAPAMPPVIDDSFETLPSGIKVRDLVAGTGALPLGGQTLVLDFVCWTPERKVFASSDDGGHLTPVLGTRNFGPGFDLALETLKVGGRRQIWLPPKLGYGPDPPKGGPTKSIPPNSALIFDVTLVGIGNESAVP